MAVSGSQVMSLVTDIANTCVRLLKTSSLVSGQLPGYPRPLTSSFTRPSSSATMQPSACAVLYLPLHGP